MGKFCILKPYVRDISVICVHRSDLCLADLKILNMIEVKVPQDLIFLLEITNLFSIFCK